MKEERENTGLKCSIQKTKIRVFGPITSWQIDGETMETVTDFILGGSKITANIDCSLLLGRKAMTNLGIILKNRDITLPTKVCLFKAMVFPVVTYGCESWTIKKAVQFSCSVVSYSLRPHGLQHARPPCPSPTPRVYSNSFPLSW